MSKPRRKPQVQICTYCGQRGEVEKDHVIPEALFVNANQATVKVWSCIPCNREKSDGEGDLRDYMVTSKRGQAHPTAKKLLPKVFDSIDKGKSRFGNWWKNAPSAPRVTPNGIFLGGTMPGSPEDFPEMERTLRFIIRGLYFHEVKSILPQSEIVDVRIIPHDLYPSIVEDFHVPFLPQPRVLGRNVFSWQPLGIGSSSGRTYWIMTFYDAVAVLGQTGGLLGFPKPLPPRKSRLTINNSKGRRERLLKRVLDRELVFPPPDDYLGFLSDLADRYK